MTGDFVQILAELLSVDCRCCAEDLGDRFCGHESEASHWREFSDRDAVAGDDEGLAFVEATHDLAAAVAEFSLCDGLTHPTTVARRATVVQEIAFAVTANLVGPD